MNGFKHLLQKHMDRKEFLRTIGLLLLAAVGLGAVVRAAKSSTTPRDTYGA